MKIGIITLSASDNCGSLLQSYALKKLLEPYGDVEIINFSSEKSHLMYDIFPKNMHRSKRELLKRGKCFFALFNEKRSYEKFRNKQLRIAGKEYFKDELFKIADKYDVLVAGSDQVWNVMMYDFDEAFFGGWSNAKKVAYAPSLGGHDVREHTQCERYIKHINEFSALSVREKKGKQCLEEVTEKKVEYVLDPTLVLDKDKWRELVKSPLVEGDYIFFYSWAYNDYDILKIVADESLRTGLPVYVVDARKWINKSPKSWGFLFAKEQGPLAFLNLMCYAKRCYVESFHGMIFSYLFKKDFWLLDTHKEYEEIDTRLKELLYQLHMEDRVLTKFNKDFIDQNTTVVYSENNLLDELKQKSKNYIKESLL